MNGKRLKLIQVARRKLGLNDDDYRAIINDYGGADSATSLDDRGFDAVMDRFRQLGFVSDRRRTAFSPHDRPGMASAAQVEMIRDRWASLTGSTDDAGLNRWLDGHFRTSALRFLSAAKAGKVIGALKTWEARLLAERALAASDDATAPGPLPASR